MTELLYISDFDIENCTALVKSVLVNDDNKTGLVLDSTCFYPRGGGQDWDTGVIKGPNGSFAVEQVLLDENGTVHHIASISSGSVKTGDMVECLVDHERRIINTRLHSAGHVIDMAIDSLRLDWTPTKGQHYPHLSAIEYSGAWDPEKSEQLKQAIENLANELIDKDHENSLEFMSPEEMRKVCKHVPGNLPKNKPGRVVFYGDKYGIPCGGTHVRHLKQIGEVKIPKLKEKKGVIRVNYTVVGIN